MVDWRLIFAPASISCSTIWLLPFWAAIMSAVLPTIYWRSSNAPCFIKAGTRYSRLNKMAFMSAVTPLTFWTLTSALCSRSSKGVSWQFLAAARISAVFPWLFFTFKLQVFLTILAIAAWPRSADHKSALLPAPVSRKMRGYFFRKAKIKYFRGDIFLDVEICRR